MKVNVSCRIDDDTWHKLKVKFKLIALGSPGFTAGFSFIVWAITDNIAWTFLLIIPWSILYVFSLLTYVSFFKKAKHTALIEWLLALMVVYYFIIMGSAALYRLFGYFGLVLEFCMMSPAVILLFRKYYSYWHCVWEIHKQPNETNRIDLINARYDYLSGFDMDENEIKKKAGKQYSNPAVMNIVYFIAPMGGGIGMILFRSQQHTIAFGLMAALSLPVALGILKPVTSQFYIYRKLVKYEKQIGSPLVNGLLD